MRRQFHLPAIVHPRRDDVESALNIFQIQRGIDRCNCRIERRTVAQGITFGRPKVWIINPELLTVAHDQAGRVAFHFAPELVRWLEPNLPRIHDRFLHQTNNPLFLKISLRNRVLANSGEEVFELSPGKRLRVSKTGQRNQPNYDRQNPAHKTTRLLDVHLSFPPRLGLSRRHCWQCKENRRDQAPKSADGTCDSEATKRRIARQTQRTETGNRR